MTATEEQHGQLDTGYPHTLRTELHKALTARGIDYWVTQGITFWNRDDGCECLAYGYQADGVPKLAIKVVGFTDPEQAIEATLGRGTCEVEESWHGESEMVEYHCTACDEYIAVEVVKPNGAQPPNLCPNCGRKVVDA